MARPKINVTAVWVLQKVLPYDGSEILNVYLDPDEVMAEHTQYGAWKYDEKNDMWFTNNDASSEGSWDHYLLLTRHPILVTRKSKPQQDVDEREALIKEVAEAMKDRYPEVQDALLRRGEHLAEVAVETIEKHNNNRPQEAP
jgi:hypothetical protein